MALEQVLCRLEFPFIMHLFAKTALRGRFILNDSIFKLKSLNRNYRNTENSKTFKSGD
jgi:hypothetical protein